MHFGLGPIGAAIVEADRSPPGFKIVGAIDIDPRRPGATSAMSSGCQAPRRQGVRRRGQDAEDRPSRTSSCCARVRRSSRCCRRSRPILKAKRPIVSTTEELSLSRLHARPAGAADSTRWPRRRRSRCSAPASIPGFAMDALPIVLTAVVRAGRPRHRQSHSGRAHRRLPFQQKIGAGLTTGAVSATGRRRQRAARRVHRVDRDDCRRAGLDARPHHRRHPAEARGGDDLERVSGGRSRLCRAASSRTASATGRASR